LIFRNEHGVGTERDLVVAAQYYCYAAMTGSRFYVQFSLADKVEFHSPSRSWGTPLHDAADKHVQILGPPDDIEASDDVLRALSLYLKSARGDGEAAVQIGQRYLTGQDAPKSTAFAWAWFQIAAKNGSTASREKVLALEKQMTGEELKSAQARQAAITADLQRVAPEVR
jgi:TPR repeat protein